MSDKRAEIELAANASRLPTGLQEGTRMLSSWASTAKGILSKINLAPKEVAKRNWVQHAAGQVVGNMAQRGIDLLIDQGKAVFDFNDKLVRFGIAAKSTPADLDAIGRAARSSAAEIGVDASAVLDAGRSYADLAGAQNFTIEKMKLLAAASQASEASTSDLSGMMYQLTQSMKVSDAEMENTMGGLINQAKEGAVEARQMSKEFGAIIPLYAKFGVLGREGAVQAGAMFQVIRDGYNTADEAGTGLQRILAGIRSYASRFEKHGVKIWNVDDKGYKHARNFSDIMKDILASDLMKDPELLKKAFGRTEGWRGFEMLAEHLERLKDLEAQGRVNGVIATDLATRTESSAGRMAIAFEKMKNAAAEAFTPERIEKFLGLIEGLVDKVGPAVDAVGALGDAYGRLVGVGQSVRGALDPNPTNNPFFDQVQNDSRAKDNATRFLTGWSPQREGSRQQTAANFREYEKTASDITAAQIDDKSTPESIRRAVEATLTPSGDPGAIGSQTAGERYLKALHIRTKEAQDKYFAERRKSDPWDTTQSPGEQRAATTGRRAPLTEDQLEANAKAIALAIQAGFATLLPMLRDAVAGKPEVKMDGNKVGSAVANSSDRKRRP